MKVQATFKKDANGNTKAKITIEALGKLYASICSGARVHGQGAMNFDAVIQYLKDSFGFRTYLKSKEPCVIGFYETDKELEAQVMDALVYAATCGKVKYSAYRRGYATRPCTHHEYFSQFVTSDIERKIETMRETLSKSTKEAFNDNYYLTNEVSLHGLSADLVRIANSTTYGNFQLSGYTLSDAVCVHKACARAKMEQWIATNKVYSKTTEIRDGFTVVEFYNGFHFEFNGEVVAPAIVFNSLKGRVPVVYKTLYNLLESSFFLKSNKAMLFNMCKEVQGV